MFITFEGIEGCGKSTQAELLADYLGGRGYGVLLTREPGGSELGCRVRSMLLSRDSTELSSEAELFLYLADRAQHVQQIIRPALELGKIVISDRYVDSTLAYQGYGRGMDLDTLHGLNRVAISGTWPGITFLLDLSPELGLSRARKRNQDLDKTRAEGRFEAEQLEFHTRVRQGYLELAASNRDRFVVLDGSTDQENLFSAVLGHLAFVWPEKKKDVDNLVDRN